jgi:heterodisulfide reductase subunit B
VALPALNLQKAQAMKHPVVTACTSCYARLRIANHIIAEQPAEKERAERITGKPYDGLVPVYHVLDVVVNHYGLPALRQQVQQPLSGLKVACYYGCLLTRPPAVVAFDNPENPTCLEDLLVALGAEPVSWPYRTECCGASLSMTQPDVVCRLAHRLLSMAREAGAQCIAVACPLCQVNLDLRQSDAVQAHGPLPPMPVLYFTQLMGLALGLSNKELGLSALSVPADSVLKVTGCQSYTEPSSQGKI